MLSDCGFPQYGSSTTGRGKSGVPSFNDDCGREEEDRGELPMFFQDEDTGQGPTCNMAVPAKCVSGVTSFCCVRSVLCISGFQSLCAWVQKNCAAPTGEESPR